MFAQWNFIHQPTQPVTGRFVLALVVSHDSPATRHHIQAIWIFVVGPRQTPEFIGFFRFVIPSDSILLTCSLCLIGTAATWEINLKNKKKVKILPATSSLLSISFIPKGRSHCCTTIHWILLSQGCKCHHPCHSKPNCQDVSCHLLMYESLEVPVLPPPTG